MVVNGFNSDDYRYFRRLDDGEIFKYKNSDLGKILFAARLSTFVPDNYKIKEYPKDEIFDVVKFINMQDKIVFDARKSGACLSFGRDEVVFVSGFLYSKLFIDDVYRTHTFEDDETFKGWNEYTLNYCCQVLLEEEKKRLRRSSLGRVFDALKWQKCFQMSKIYSFKEKERFVVPRQEGDVWDLSNPDVAFLLLNQAFLANVLKSQEIIGEEKLRMFADEYKDNVPNTRRRYYKVKEGISIYSLGELVDFRQRDNSFPEGFFSIPDENLKFCECNPNNFNEDGTIKYIAISYDDTSEDLLLEQNVLKIADRLPLEEALKRYNEDQVSLEKQYVKQEIRRK